MLNLTEAEVLDNIKQGKPIEAQLAGFTLKVLKYVPYVCTAIHNGHTFRTDLAAQCLLTEEERRFEEDPYTEDVIASMPIVLSGTDSRYEYDLNRSLEQCVYREAWGKQVWKTPLTDRQLQKSHDKHQQFYRISQALIATLELRFGAVVVYDIHAYNYKRHTRETPTFNIGTAQADRTRWQKEIQHFMRHLRKISLPHLEVSVARDKVFKGNGYLAVYTRTHFQQTLVLPTEIKKIYMDESSGEMFPQVLLELTRGLVQAITVNANYYAKRNTHQQR